jgi:two-component system, OmpR family, sensor kinase
MSRVPVRVRLAAAFAVAMALVLVGAGAFLYGSLGADLSHALDQDLRLRAQDLSVLVIGPGGSLATATGGQLVERGESFAQLLDARGRVLDETHTLGTRPLIDSATARVALRRRRFVDRPLVEGLDEPARLLATPIDRRGHRAVLIVGATRENRAEALRSLRTKLLIAGPIALLLTTGFGYLLAGSALRTVDAMRRRAGDISADNPSERLPVPRTGDELQRLGETLNAMLDRLRAALERERGFLAEAGHELRTPLALLRAELDFALHYADSEQELRDAVKTASEETDRLVQLAGDLLLIASTDDGRLALRREPIAARELLESVRKRFAWRAESQGRPLAHVHAPAELIVTGDRLRLEQALGNLVDNALRHGAGTVQLAACTRDHSVEVHVSDEGPGFSADLLPRAFQRFSRADDARGGSGAGLGLAIVDTIARAHHGTANASNPAQGGADVYISLPLLAPGATAANSHPSSLLVSAFQTVDLA